MPPALVSVSLCSTDLVRRPAWCGALGQDGRLLVLDCCATLDDARTASEARPPQVAVLDLAGDAAEALAFIGELRARRVAPAVLALGPAEARLILPALQAGAVGYLAYAEATPAQLPEAILAAHAGGAPLSPGVARHVVDFLAQQNRAAATPPILTPRERDVLAQLALGGTYGDVGARLGMAEDTVRAHIRSLYRKLQVNSRAEALSRCSALLAN